MAEKPVKLGRYPIESILGEGAMGVVYSAYDKAFERRVAIKTIRKELLGDQREDLLARFQVEAQAAGRLNNTKIVAVHDYGEDGGTPYIVMEYAPGRTLLDCLKERMPLQIKDIVHIMLQLLDALNTAHKHQIVHRDIKPANILLLDGLDIKVTDFGIAKIDASNLTLFGGAIGTPNYMSPEQWNGQPVDSRSDLFSAGVVLYELLTGKQPFSGENHTVIKHRALNVAPPRPSELDPKLSPVFDKIVQRAMAKQPADRFQSAMEFLEALRTADEDRTLPRPLPAAGSTAPKRRTYLWVAPACGGAVAVAVALWLWPTPPPPAPGNVILRSDPVGAVVTLANGEFVGITPTRVQLAPGQYQIVLKKEGYRDLAASVEVDSATDIPVELTLHKVGFDSP